MNDVDTRLAPAATLREGLRRVAWMELMDTLRLFGLGWQQLHQGADPRLERMRASYPRSASPVWQARAEADYRAALLAEPQWHSNLASAERVPGWLVAAAFVGGPIGTEAP